MKVKKVGVKAVAMLLALVMVCSTLSGLATTAQEEIMVGKQE